MTTHLQQFMTRKKWSCADMVRHIDAALKAEAPAIRHKPLSRSLVSKWANGKCTPDLRYALAIHAVCGRSVPLSSLVVWR